MANATIVGGNKDPPDPSTANINTGALATAVHRAKNAQVSTEIDEETQFLVHIEDADEDSPTLQVQPPTISPSTANPGTDTISPATRISSSSAKTDSPMPTGVSNNHNVLPDTNMLEWNNNPWSVAAYQTRVAAPNATSHLHNHPDADTLMTDTDTPDNSRDKTNSTLNDQTTPKWTQITI
mmetsp:Transcript_4604/g.9862  ORF Transcript_4604/g.9862 Transcript_4604/m.9862 type:complete len:181 (-) Transcript_4604:54-596(-)